MFYKHPFRNVYVELIDDLSAKILLSDFSYYKVGDILPIDKVVWCSISDEEMKRIFKITTFQ